MVVIVTLPVGDLEHLVTLVSTGSRGELVIPSNDVLSLVPSLEDVAAVDFVTVAVVVEVEGISGADSSPVAEIKLFRLNFLQTQVIQATAL